MECEHFVQKTPDILPNTKGCQECEVEKTPWVAIRMCLTCGHVGCCDSWKACDKTFRGYGHDCNGGSRWRVFYNVHSEYLLEKNDTV